MASPFASHTTSDPIPLPFDPPHWVQVRKLTGRELEQVQEAHRDGIRTSNPRVWAAFFRRALERGSASDPEVQQLLTDPLTGHDRYGLVRFGLVAWSYPQPIKPELVPATSNGSFKVPGPDAIEDLDDEAVDFIARQVLRLTKPALFAATEEDAAAEKKRGSPVSITT